jgi:hypothetical protein
MKRTCALIALALAAACGSGDEGGEAGDSGADIDLGEVNERLEDAPACDDLAGRPTAELLELSVCDDGDGGVILGSTSHHCVDGRELHWNDYGWGYSDGPWQAHARPDGQAIPPDAETTACTG